MKASHLKIRSATHTNVGLNEASTIASAPINIEKASGVYLWDDHGNKYLDLFSQTWSLPLGHNRPKVIEAVENQIKKVTHLRTAFTTNEKLELANFLIENSPEHLKKVNFTLHGSLANEGAMKLAINNYKHREKILYLEDGFHGRSFATMGVSWKIPNSKYKSYYTNGIEVKKNLIDIENKMLTQKPAAIIIELVQGNCGFQILDKALVKGIRELCTKHDVVMIIDEIQTAFGCVEDLFLSHVYDVSPDIITFGKAIGGGFPLAGIIYKDKFCFHPGEHSFTFAHSPIGFAAATAFIKELQKESYKANVLYEHINSQLEELQEKYSFLSGVRAIGTKGAMDVELNNFQKSCEIANVIVDKMLERKIIISASRYRGLGNSIMLQAPLILEIEVLKEAFHQLDEVIEDVSRTIGREYFKPNLYQVKKNVQ